ncbi:hypothetical protein JXA40_08550 [bacterium]|nr:hypothetical protein [candidate division CSSED10-310 bacterium]
MKKIIFCVIVLVLWMNPAGYGQEIKAEDCMFLKSLHYSARGMEYWYSKETGGLETVTGVPYSDLGCRNCHVKGCDVCHLQESDDHAVYSTKAATNQVLCLKCHGRERAIMNLDHEAGQDDVHHALDMVCTDCHTARELHGDGTVYRTMKQEGAMQVGCGDCHAQIKPSEAHRVHGDRLECKACHQRHVVSCTNCHFDFMVKTGKRISIPVSGWVFLINYRNQVTSASMQTFLANKDETFMIFAPHMSHSIMAEGRRCGECHGSDMAKQVQSGKLKLTWLENGKVVNAQGVIPVVDGVDYECVYQDRQGDQWVPIDKPAKPGIQYPAYGEPLTRDQLEKMVKMQEILVPAMK